MSDDLPELQAEALTVLRDQLDVLDKRLIETIAERQNVVAKIGEYKARSGHPTRDFKREKILLNKARKIALDADVDPQLAVSVLKTLVRGSLQSQERARVQFDGRGSGKSVLVVGGAGRMGGWFVDFFVSQGFAVHVADPAADQTLPNRFADLTAAGTDYDIIVLATTLALTADILQRFATTPPRGLVFDVGSLKSPLKPALAALAAAGVRITSLHPMFGPATQLLAGRQVIFIDVGNAEATSQARALFAATMATCIDMDIDEHDRLIAYVLGMSHMINIAFVDALAHSGVDARLMTKLSSPTFDAQRSMGQTVVSENPDLYYEIQKLNEFGDLPLDGLLRSVSKLRDAIAGDDQQAFVAAMRDGRRYLDSATQPSR